MTDPIPVAPAEVSTSSGLRAFDLHGFAQELHSAIRARGITQRQTAREAGVSPSSITRILSNGKSPDVDTLAALCAWGDLAADDYILRDRPLPEMPRRDAYADIRSRMQDAMDAPDRLIVRSAP